MDYVKKLMIRRSLFNGQGLVHNRRESRLRQAYAEEAVAHGDYVVAAMRTVRTDDAFLNDEHVLPVSMDVTDERQITDAVQAAVDKFGHIDVLVNNAGFGFFGAFEETSDAELRAVMETNVFGVAGVTRAVIP